MVSEMVHSFCTIWNGMGEAGYAANVNCTAHTESRTVNIQPFVIHKDS